MAKNDDAKQDELVKREDEKEIALMQQKIDVFTSELNESYMDAIQAYCSSGYKKSLARLLCYLDENRRLKALKDLEEDNPTLADEVKKLYEQIEDKSPENPEVMAEAAQALGKSNIEEFSISFLEKEYVEKKLNQVLIFKKAETYCETNPILEMNLKNAAHTVDDILLLDDRSVQRFLREISSEDLARVMHDLPSDSEVSQKIYRNMSRRAAAMLQEEIEFMGPVRQIDIHDASRKVSMILQKLEKDGEIILPRYI